MLPARALERSRLKQQLEAELEQQLEWLEQKIRPLELWQHRRRIQGAESGRGCNWCDVTFVKDVTHVHLIQIGSNLLHDDSGHPFLTRMEIAGQHRLPNSKLRRWRRCRHGSRSLRAKKVQH